MSDPAAVRAHVEKIHASPGFANADRLRRFLHFTVEAHLKGEADQIKEYVLGKEVFDRDDTYDPRLDPIVRVEARRLRQRLAEYYAGPGQGDSLRIEFPKGTYTPAISSAQAPESAAPTRRTGLVLAGLGAAGVLGVAGWYWTRPAKPNRSVAVVPARWTFLDPAGLLEFDEPLCEAVTAQLANAGKVDVIAWPSILPFRQKPTQSRELARQTSAAMVLAVSVRPMGAQHRVTVFLVEPFTNLKRWAEDFYAQNLQDPAEIQKVAATIATDLQITLGV